MVHNVGPLYRPVPQPQIIEILLNDTGNSEGTLISDSLACNKCYEFCQTYLQHCDEDLRPQESIIIALKVKVDVLHDKLQQCSSTADSNETGGRILYRAKCDPFLMLYILLTGSIHIFI